MVKLLHAADLHLDSAFSALPPEKAVQRRAEQRLVLERLTALMPLMVMVSSGFTTVTA